MRSNNGPVIIERGLDLGGAFVNRPNRVGQVANHAEGDHAEAHCELGAQPHATSKVFLRLDCGFLDGALLGHSDLTVGESTARASSEPP